MVKSVRNKLYKLLSCADGTSISDCSTLKPNSSSPMKKNLALQIHTTSQREHKFKPGLNSTSQSRAQLFQLQQGAPEHLPLTDRSARGIEKGKEGRIRKEGAVQVGRFGMDEWGLVQSKTEGERKDLTSGSVSLILHVCLYYFDSSLSLCSNEFEVVSLDHDVSPAGVYRWKVSAYAPCSSSCTTGAIMNQHTNMHTKPLL